MNAREKRVAFTECLDSYEHTLNLMFWLEHKYDFGSKKEITEENKGWYEKELIRARAYTIGIEKVIKAAPQKMKDEFYKIAFERKAKIEENQKYLVETYLPKKQEEKTENTAA